MSLRSHEGGLSQPSNSQLRSSYCHLDHGDNPIRGSWLHSSQRSSEINQLMPPALSEGNTSKSQSNQQSGNGDFSESEGSSLKLPRTDDSLYNTGHSNYQTLEPLPQGSYIHDSLPGPSFPCEEGSDASFFYLGAQFDTTDSENVALPAEDGCTGSLFSGTTFDTIDRAVRSGEDSQTPSEVNTPTDAMEYLGLAGSPALGDGLSQDGIRTDPSPSNIGRDSHTLADLPTYEYQRPSIVVTDQFGRNTIPVADDLHRSLIGDDSVTSATHVERAYELVQALNNSWMQRLTPELDLHAQCLSLSPRWLFLTGIRTLKRCYRGSLPATFNEIFGLMHIAFAFSQAIQKDGGSCYWDGFSTNVHDWHHAIVDDTESHLFLRAWLRLWRPQGSTPAIPPPCRPLDTIADTSMSIAKDDVKIPYTSRLASVVKWRSDSVLQSPMDRDRNDLLKRLMGGMVIEGCSRFLDAIEYVAIVERNAQNLSRAPYGGAQTSLIDSVTKPLEQCRAVKMIPEHLLGINNKLRNGFLRNVRELEVALISCPEWARIPSQIHSAYLDQVAIQCDKAVEYPSLNWRSHYYRADLRFVIALFSGLEQQRHSSSKSSPQAQPASASPLILPSINTPDLTIYYSGDSRNTVTLAPLPPVGFGASEYSNYPHDNLLNSSLTALQDSRAVNAATSSVTSSDFLSDDSLLSNQPVSEPSSQTTTGNTICPRCAQVFEGTPVNQRRNARRHMHSKHSIDSRLPCLVPQCHTTFARGRYDNLNRHMEKQHGPSTARKRKASEMT